MLGGGKESFDLPRPILQRPCKKDPVSQPVGRPAARQLVPVAAEWAEGGGREWRTDGRKKQRGIDARSPHRTQTEAFFVYCFMKRPRALAEPGGGERVKDSL